jgi:hypothetical protein
MASIDVEHVIGRLATRGEFRKLFSEDPDKALADYNLTADEREMFKDVPGEPVEAFYEALKTRVRIDEPAYRDEW